MALDKVCMSTSGVEKTPETSFTCNESWEVLFLTQENTAELHSVSTVSYRSEEKHRDSVKIN